MKGVWIGPFLAVVSLTAQPQPPTFEVASVRMDTGASGPVTFPGGGPGSSNPERFTATRIPLSLLLLRAFEIETDQLDGPGWLREQTYTISAVVPPNTTKQQFQLMLQNLLTERFGLRTHWETRPFPGYELTVAPGGPKPLTKWTPEPIPEGASQRARTDADGFPVVPQGVTMSQYGFTPGKTATLKVSVRQSMAGFSKDLGRFTNFANSAPAGEPIPRVVDKTGLPDVYEFRLEFEGTVNMAAFQPRPAQDVGGGEPSLFSALEKQLGLRLVKVGNAPVPVLVVDHADKLPSEN